MQCTRDRGLQSTFNLDNSALVSLIHAAWDLPTRCSHADDTPLEIECSRVVVVWVPNQGLVKVALRWLNCHGKSYFVVGRSQEKKSLQVDALSDPTSERIRNGQARARRGNE